ncbi:MAG: hypothetical protein P8J75_07115 [Actinomycetota bacterium]|nr:hypothetical protein [Actinomycetota bacterium]
MGTPPVHGTPADRWAIRDANRADHKTGFAELNVGPIVLIQFGDNDVPHVDQANGGLRFDHLSEKKIEACFEK